MATRSTAHAGEETAIFNAFVAAHPSFDTQIKKVEQPDAEVPDVIVELKSGTFIDFQLGELGGVGHADVGQVGEQVLLRSSRRALSKRVVRALEGVAMAGECLRRAPSTGTSTTALVRGSWRGLHRIR